MTDPATDIGHNRPPSEEQIALGRAEQAALPLAPRLQELEEAVERIPEAIDDDVASKITLLIKQIGEAKKALEKARREITDPFLAAQRAVKGYFDTFTGRAEKAQKRAKDRLQPYLEEQERQRREKAAQAAMEAQELAAKAETAEQAKAAAEKARQAQDLEAPARARSGYGQTASMRRRWVLKGVVDISLVPKAYLAVDTVAVNEAIRSGIHEIPGLDIQEETSVASR